MKKIYLKIIILGLILTSCDSYLEEENLSFATAESFYVTAEGFESLINANYSLLRDIYGDDPWMFCAGTDMYAEGRNQEPTEISQYLTLGPGTSEIEPLYLNCYNSIQKANMAIYYSEITEASENIAARVGEIKYLRANAYFLLVQSYGGVAIVRDFIDSPVLEFDRNSAEEVYNFIIEDLNAALASVADGAFQGRVTKQAVEHLLAKVYLTRGYESFGSADDFSNAASYADSAIGGRTLDIDFETLWYPGNEMNDETIFSVQFDAGSVSSDPTGIGSKQSYFFGSYLGGSEVAGNAPNRSYNLLATDYVIDLFEKGDERWDATFMIEMYERYYDYFEVDDKSGLTVSDFYEPSWFTAQERNDYLAAHPGVTYHEYGSYAAGIATADKQKLTSKKFDDPTQPFSNDRSGTRDIILSRLGETYLIAAEAYFQSGNSAVALERINEVRRRANVSMLSSIDLDVILDERARELFGEYHRWFDLKRTGTLVERASMYHYLIDEANFNGANGELKILRPIPQTAIDLNQNNNFPQNPAYE